MFRSFLNQYEGSDSEDSDIGRDNMSVQNK